MVRFASAPLAARATTADTWPVPPFEWEELFRFIDHLGDPEGQHLPVQ